MARRRRKRLPRRSSMRAIGGAYRKTACEINGAWSRPFDPGCNGGCKVRASDDFRPVLDPLAVYQSAPGETSSARQRRSWAMSRAAYASPQEITDGTAAHRYVAWEFRSEFRLHSKPCGTEFRTEPCIEFCAEFPPSYPHFYWNFALDYPR